MDIVERFLTYAKVNTQSDETSGIVPSTLSQMDFAQRLAADLEAIGMSDVSVSEYGYVTATLPSNTSRELPTVGFIAHMDTSPDFSAKHVNPRIVTNYDGKDIVLNEEKGIVLSPTEFPELQNYQGQDIIVTDGTTLLGADDKAGIAAIFSAMEALMGNPSREHGKIRVCFTPDEEIGQGADHFDVEAFGADFAYTIDGGAIGELEFETFNAAEAVVVINGRNVHPGYAYHKMRNSMRIASQFTVMLPSFQTPEHTNGYDGFFHLNFMEGTVEKTTLKYIIRDFKRDRFEDRKKEMLHLTNKLNAEFGPGTVETTIRDQYYNMREKIEPVMYVVDYARQAMADCGVECKTVPVRGGTDGSRLSFMGLPTPNIFAGGENFHGKYEYLPIPSLRKAGEVVARLAEVVAAH
ncbi:MAG: peptidase T [Bacteroidales bacterium]|nr:peptidase T [Bacteroidales bacterium]